jgi:uncharacterized protein YbaR (Trm112 family)
MVLPETLLKILVCPVDKGCLMYFADEDLLYNPRLRRGYRIAGGVPVMLADRAEPVQGAEHERLMTRARDGAADLSGFDLPGLPGLAGQLPGGRDGRALPGHRERRDGRAGRRREEHPRLDVPDARDSPADLLDEHRSGTGARDREVGGVQAFLEAVQQRPRTEGNQHLPRAPRQVADPQRAHAGRH